MTFEKPSEKEWPEEIHLHDTNFSFFKTRAFDQGVLYKSENSYLRLGEAQTLQHELDCHKGFEELGFPVSKILDEGDHGESRYYIEEDIGAEPFHEIFHSETKEKGEISQETFENFLRVIKQCTEAQSKHASLPSEEDVEGYFKTWFFDDVADEVPHLRESFQAAKSKAVQILESFPAVLSHNDFNAYNILPGGIIDFAYGQKMPLGYDWTSLMMHPGFFPNEEGFESRRKYEFSEEQKEVLRTVFSDALEEKGFKYEDILPTLLLGRMVWSAAHMGKAPKLQEWRFEKLEAMLKDYLAS
jgi:hypothetical protein